MTHFTRYTPSHPRDCSCDECGERQYQAEQATPRTAADITFETLLDMLPAHAGARIVAEKLRDRNRTLERELADKQQALNDALASESQAHADLVALRAALSDFVNFVSPGDDESLAAMLDEARAALAKTGEGAGDAYAARVRELEAEGLTTSDAQAAADAEALQVQS